MGLRSLAREVARNASYRMVGSNDMFETNFVNLWVQPRLKREEKKRKEEVRRQRARLSGRR